MNNEDYDEQVFTVSDADDASGDCWKPFKNGQNKTERHYDSNYVSNYDSSRDGGVLKAIMGFFAIGLSATLFIILISLFFGKITTSIVVATLCVIALFFILFFRGFAPQNNSRNQNISLNVNKNKSKRIKKYNNVQEYKMSSEYKNSNEYKLEEMKRKQEEAKRIAEERLAQEELQKSARKQKDEIELAVEALVRLGFGSKRATEWVMRGIESGISSSETQKLIKYALNRGA